jgi:hypothetical protein
MRIMPVDAYPLKKEYGSPKAAMEGAKNNPLQPIARTDAEELLGTTIVDAYWTDTDFVIRFSNQRFLHIRVALDACQLGDVRWEVLEAPPAIRENELQRVGAEPVIHRWRPELGDHVHDCSALTTKRIGAEFERLFVNEAGLLVYFRGRSIWFFSAIRRTDLDQPILFVAEND